MGLNKTRTGAGGNGQFLNFKEGKIIAYVNGQNEEFEELEDVYLMELDVQDAKYNNEDYRKVVLYLLDKSSSQVYQLGMSISSGYAWSFFAMSPNLDFKKPMSISGSLQKMEGTEKKYSKMFIKQDGKNVKWYFKAGEKAMEKVPAPKDVKVGNKIIKDFSERDAYVEQKLFDLYKKKIQKDWPDGAPKSAKAKAPENAEPADDIPF